jgi:hypothetical protein
MWKDEHNYVVAKNGIVNRARFVETLSASFPLIWQWFEPDGRVGTREKGVDGFCLIGVRVKHLASNGRVMMDRLGKMGIHGTLRRKGRRSKMWAPAKNGWKRGRLGE